jgi:hypothetical protein
LNPRAAHPIAHFSGFHIGSHGNNLPNWLMTENSRKFSRKMSERLMYVGVTDAARMHLHQHLI